MQHIFRLAGEEDVPLLVELVNGAYRGDSGRMGWTTEADLLAGQRVDAGLLREELARPSSRILLLEPFGESAPLGCVQVEKKTETEASFGMLTVSVEKQRAGIGRSLLELAERFVAETWGSTTMTLSVISGRTELIEWYRRRGYEITGEKRPFPLGDARFGIPLVENLHFDVMSKSLGSESVDAHGINER
jgi:ribosomal protein S18 acetylase RimI-like enzyme